MSLTYRASEFTCPPGFSVKDLDWVAFSWDLVGADRYSDAEEMFVQFILAPGMLVVRSSTFEDDLFSVDGQQISADIIVDPDPEGSLVAMGWAKTAEYLRSGYKLVQEPFLLDFTDGSAAANIIEYFYDRDWEMTPITLGDAIQADDYQILEMIYGMIAYDRALKQAARD